MKPLHLLQGTLPIWEGSLLTAFPILVICGLIFGILLSIELGYRFGRRPKAHATELIHGSSSTIEASVFGLMGLLIAFIFAGAAVRFDNRRLLIAQEANAIETGYFRLDLLPHDSQPKLREDFRAYLRSRIAVTRNVPDMKSVSAELQHSSRLQRKIWNEAVAAAQGSDPATRMLVFSALEEMIDITKVRTVAIISHLPLLVFVLLAVTIVLASFWTGYSMSGLGRRDWLSAMIFTIMVASATYVIVDYEYPRVGLIRVGAVDQLLTQTLDEME